jgi:hypothetical protein
MTTVAAEAANGATHSHATPFILLDLGSVRHVNRGLAAGRAPFPRRLARLTLDSAPLAPAHRGSPAGWPTRILPTRRAGSGAKAPLSAGSHNWRLGRLMVRVPQEPRQGTQYVWDVGRIAMPYGNYAENKHHKGDRDHANASEPEHGQPPYVGRTRLNLPGACTLLTLL